jgi:hypothetical protein
VEEWQDLERRVIAAAAVAVDSIGASNALCSMRKMCLQGQEM